MKYLAPAFLALALFAPAAHGASFDCAQAGTRIEKMICSDPRLSKLDEVLGDRYRWVLSRADNAKGLRTEQRAWLKDIRDVCVSRSCLENAYKTRIAKFTEAGCAQAGKEADPAVCAETELEKLEALMDDRYARALAKAADPEAVKAKQQAWLRDVRDSCAYATCLKAVYRARIHKLEVMYGLFTVDQAASFDCAKAGTKIEKLICGDAELSKLDELLGDRYVRALAKAEDANAVKAEQRAWLRGPRKACADAPCLKAAYETRIAELTKIGWMTDEKARAICERVADAMVDQSYRASFRRTKPNEIINLKPGPGLQGYHFREELDIDYDSDGKVEKIGSISAGGGGTCQSYYANRIIDVTYWRPDPDEVYIDWHEGSQAFLVVNGEPVLVREPAETGYKLLTWLTPAGQQQALCSIGFSYSSHFKTEKDDNPELCSAVVESRIAFSPWEPFGPEQKDAFSVSHGGSSEGSRVLVDIDQDGEVDTIASLILPSSAGCGHTYRWLVELSPNLASVEDSAVNRVLTRGRKDPLSWPQWAPLSGPSGANWTLPRIFNFKDKPYLLVRGRAAPYLDSEVISLWGGTARTWCGYATVFKHEKTNIGYFPVKPPTE